MSASRVDRPGHGAPSKSESHLDRAGGQAQLDEVGKHAHHDHGDHAASFRDRFWLSLVLSLPVVVYSPTVQHWFGYSAPSFARDDLVAPVLGTVVYLYGGRPFLAGAVDEVRTRRPGMMLLIAMAITVAFAASMTTSLGVSSRSRVHRHTSRSPPHRARLHGTRASSCPS